MKVVFTVIIFLFISEWIFPHYYITPFSQPLITCPCLSFRSVPHSIKKLFLYSTPLSEQEMWLLQILPVLCICLGGHMAHVPYVSSSHSHTLLYPHSLSHTQIHISRIHIWVWGNNVQVILAPWIIQTRVLPSPHHHISLSSMPLCTYMQAPQPPSHISSDLYIVSPFYWTALWYFFSCFPAEFKQKPKIEEGKEEPSDLRILNFSQWLYFSSASNLLPLPGKLRSLEQF
jgi:hypothetical protein